MIEPSAVHGMKEYNFNSIIAWRLWFMGFILCVVLVLVSIVNNEYLELDPLWIVVLSVTILMICYLASLKFVICPTKLVFDEQSIIVTRNNGRQTIPIAEIISYKINLMRGARIDMKLTNGNKVVLIGSDYFRKWKPLEQFCHDFDEYIRSLSDSGIILSQPNEEHKMGPIQQSQIEPKDEPLMSYSQTTADPIEGMRNKGRIVPRREKPFYERKYALPILLMLSAFIIGVLLYIYLIDKGSPNGPMITGIAGLIAMWGAYLKHAAK
jgi:hypothetical protein